MIKALAVVAIFLKLRPQFISAVVASFMLLIAIAPLSYDYYKILRWVICLIALHIGSIGALWRGYGKWWVAIVFGCIAILFNPINPADLAKAVWIPIDLVCFALFTYIAVTMKKPAKEVYGIVEITSGLFAMAWFTAFAFAGLLLLRELLGVFH